jgi:hypothetical protein
MNILEQYLNAKGFNRTTITSLIDTSPPTTRLIMENPLQLKLSQVISIANATESQYQEIAGLIFNTHNFVNNGDSLQIFEKLIE